jgi:hypothetical protein
VRWLISTKPERERGQVLKVYTTWQYNPVRYLQRSFIGGCGLFLLFLLGLVAVGLVFEEEMPTPLPDWFLSIFLLSPFMLSAWWNTRVRMVVREKGLEIHHSFRGSGIFTTWDNLSHIEIVEVDTSAGETGGITYHRVLHLKHPVGECAAIDIGQFIIINYLTYSTGQWTTKRYYRIIDPDKLVQNTFGQYLLAYALHVIEAAKTEKERLETLLLQSS